MLGKGFGGAERLFVDLVIEQNAAGIKVLPICHPRGKARQLIEAAGIKCACVRSMGWWDPLAPLRIRRLAIRFNADVIHTHLARATCLTAKAKIRRPFVASLHNYGKSRYYLNADWYLPITNDGARHLQAMGISRDRITVMPNFSRLAAVAGPHASVHQPPRLIAYGRFVEKKGFADLIRALSLLKQRGIAFELQLGGDGSLNESLRTLVSKQGLEDSIRFSGWLDDIVTALDRSDLFILPSRSEPFGIVVLEAMARGVPIVSTRTEGPSEILSDTTAFLAAVNDPDSLADAIETALTGTTERDRKAVAALSLYQREYTANAVVPRIISLYRKLLRTD